MTQMKFTEADITELSDNNYGETEINYQTCRWCRNFANGRCCKKPMEVELYITDLVEKHIDDGEVTELFTEIMPNHINNIIGKLVPELPAKWKKAISTALQDADISSYWDMTDDVERWLRHLGDSLICHEAQEIVVSDPNDFSCKYFE